MLIVLLRRFRPHLYCDRSRIEVSSTVPLAERIGQAHQRVQRMRGVAINVNLAERMEQNDARLSEMYRDDLSDERIA